MNWECRNAMRCTTEGCTAKAEIEALRKQVEFQNREHIEMQKYTLQLEAKVAELTQAHELNHDRYNTLHMTYTEAYNQLAAMTKLWENEYRLRCEAQARIVELREALEGLREYSMCHDTMVRLLDTPNDLSALDRRLQEERERCAKHLDFLVRRGELSISECSAAIYAIKEMK